MVDRKDPDHGMCSAAMRSERQAVLVPQPTLTEVCYLVNSRLGTAVEREFLLGLSASDWGLEPLTRPDLDRIVDLLGTYASANLGFVDAATVAIAERLDIERIYTLDRRDFAMVRPRHVSAFIIAP